MSKLSPPPLFLSPSHSRFLSVGRDRTKHVISMRSHRYIDQHQLIFCWGREKESWSYRLYEGVCKTLNSSNDLALGMRRYYNRWYMRYVPMVLCAWKRQFLLYDAVHQTLRIPGISISTTFIMPGKIKQKYRDLVKNCRKLSRVPLNNKRLLLWKKKQVRRVFARYLSANKYLVHTI